MTDRPGAAGRLRRYLRDRRPWFEPYQRRLVRAGITTTYDRYLVQGIRYGVPPIVAGIVLAAALVALGATLPGLLVGAAGLTVGGSVLAGWYLYPAIRADEREREIDGVLPYALVTMAALTEAGMSPVRVVERIAAAEGAYGELAAEFAGIRRDVTYFGDDLLTAVEAAAGRTPSDRLGTFLTNLATAMESSVSFGEFLERERRRQLAAVRDRQRAFVERLTVFAQFYIVVTFVAPILVFVFLVLLSFGGANTLAGIYLVAYPYPVVAIAGFVAILGRLGRGIDLPRSGGDPEEAAPSPPETADPRLAAYRRAKRRRAIRAWDPLATLRRRPATALLVTVPLALAGIGIAALVAGIGPGAFYASEPILATAALVGVVVAAATPFAVLDRARRRRERAMVEDVPDICEALAEAITAGMTPVEAFGRVAERRDGPLVDAMAAVHGEARLTGDPGRALMDRIRRFGVPEVTLTMTTLDEGIRATTDLEGVLTALADAAEDRSRLAAERREAMGLYAVVIVIGLGAFLAVAVFLHLFFLPRLAAVSEGAGQGLLAAPAVSPETYRTVLFHAALIQAGGNGLFIGKLRNGRLSSGLPYSLALLVVVTASFLAVFLP